MKEFERKQQDTNQRSELSSKGQEAHTSGSLFTSAQVFGGAHVQRRLNIQFPSRGWTTTSQGWPPVLPDPAGSPR